MINKASFLNTDIRYIKRKDLDLKSYNHCIAQAVNTMIYAYSWFLDCVADDWDVLVFDDYKAVMPIPFLKLKRNLFIKKIYQPDFCQQLGIYSKNILEKDIVEGFFKQFLNLKPKSYHFNYFDSKEYFNTLSGLTERDNYELKLNASYQDVYSNYSKNTKRNLKKAQKHNLSVTHKVTLEEFLIFKKNQTQYKSGSRHLNKMKQLIQVAIKTGNGKFYSIYYENKLIAATFVLVDKHRIINLISASSEIGKKSGATHLINDYIINKHIETNVIFDFEGSMIPGIARFFKSFGAEKMGYRVIV